VTESRIRTALEDAVREVLEKMFFIDILRPSACEAPRTGAVAAQVAFIGDPPGVFRLDLDPDAAGAAAASFLGEAPEELTPQRIQMVVCELANMLCGFVLSRVESSVTFRLSTPEIAGNFMPCPPTAEEDCFQAELADGMLRAEIRMERAVCPRIDAPAF
jgi:CheY-specific phosphatase CheX